MGLLKSRRVCFRAAPFLPPCRQQEFSARGAWTPSPAKLGSNRSFGTSSLNQPGEGDSDRRVPHAATRGLSPLAHLDPLRAAAGTEPRSALSLPGSGIFHQAAILEDPVPCFYLPSLLFLCSEYMNAKRIFCSSSSSFLSLLFALCWQQERGGGGSPGAPLFLGGTRGRGRRATARGQQKQ